MEKPKCPSQAQKEFDMAWKEFFRDKNKPENDDEEKKQMEEFIHWYNNIRKQSDTGKTPAQMYKEIYGIESKDEIRIMNFEWDENYDEELLVFIEELKEYDNVDGYKLNYETVRKKLEPTIDNILKKREKALDLLHDLLENEAIWSCLFALEIIKEIKSEKSVPYLIEFIKKNEYGDYWDVCEDASNALIAIGEQSIKPLLMEIKKNFSNKTDYGFLTDALTGMKDDRVYNFMKVVLEDYIEDYKKYDGWFDIDSFVYNFDKQRNEEIIPLLEKLLIMDQLSNTEKREIKDTIEIIKNPSMFQKNIKKEFEKDDKTLFARFNNFLEILAGNKKIDREDVLERSNERDEEFEGNFICKECKNRQNIKTGLIWSIDDKKGKKYAFEYEIMCKYCHSNNLELSKRSSIEVNDKELRIITGDDKGILPIEKITIEGNVIRYSESYDYILKRIREESENGELYLRGGNIARKFNKYDESIELYKEAIELNPKLISSYINLIEIYEYRHRYYKIKDAKKIAVFYFNKMLDLFRTQDYDTSTIRNKYFVVQFMGELSESLGVDVPELFKIPLNPNKKIKIGKNDPCSCGSGKKYKKCCLEKE